MARLGPILHIITLACLSKQAFIKGIWSRSLMLLVAIEASGQTLLQSCSGMAGSSLMVEMVGRWDFYGSNSAKDSGRAAVAQPRLLCLSMMQWRKGCN